MSRRTATLFWAALLVVPFAFLAVARKVAAASPDASLVEPLFWLAIAASVLNVTLARVLPPRLGPSRAHAPGAVAFARILVSLALCEAAALAPLVAYMLTRDARLLAIAALDVLALAVLFPSDRRWDALMPGPDAAAPGAGRTVR